MLLPHKAAGDSQSPKVTNQIGRGQKHCALTPANIFKHDFDAESVEYDTFGVNGDGRGTRGSRRFAPDPGLLYCRFQRQKFPHTDAM